MTEPIDSKVDVLMGEALALASRDTASSASQTLMATIMAAMADYLAGDPPADSGTFIGPRLRAVLERDEA